MKYFIYKTLKLCSYDKSWCYFSDNQLQSRYPSDFSKSATSQQSTPQAGGNSEETHDRREVIQCKLRRLRNLYLLVNNLVFTQLTFSHLVYLIHSYQTHTHPVQSTSAVSKQDTNYLDSMCLWIKVSFLNLHCETTDTQVRPFVTGVKLTRDELHEIFQSREGFFEPSLNEAQKIALVSRMAETIRQAHVTRQLVTDKFFTPFTYKNTIIWFYSLEIPHSSTLQLVGIQRYRKCAILKVMFL